MTPTIVVTGGGSGIGAAVVRRLVADGEQVSAVGRRREPLDALRAELGDAVLPITADVSTPAGAAAVAEQVDDCRGVVAAAGGLSTHADDGLGGVRQAWQDSFASNVLTAVLVVEALRAELSDVAGRVVLISSVAALRGSGGGPYGAMKAALHAYAFDLARDFGRTGGTANVVAPGFVPDTEFWDGRRTPELVTQRAAQTLVGRPGSPQEVASLIAWLLGPDGGWVTGQVLSPNGGVVLGR
jgi:3-oxoacyl-[acyl-carrier protein] reductase